MEPNNILDIFFSLENPAIYAIIFTVMLLVLVILIKQEFIRPLAKRKRKLELEVAKLAALYSEVDPDPIIRVDEDWKVIDMNNSAKDIANKGNESLDDLVSEIRSKKENKKDYSVLMMGKEFYSVSVEIVKELKFIHIYLHDMTRRILYEEEIKNYQDNLRELRIKVDTVNEEEKQRIGKELHDSVGHSLSLLKIELQIFLENKRLDINEKEVKGVLHSIDQLSEEVRELSHELRPRILGEFGLVQAIKSLVDRINLQGKIKGFVIQNKEFRIDEIILEQNIYRICQEALNNIIKHSNCSEFYLDFNLNSNILDVKISDDGRGFNLDEQYSRERASLGIFNMKERAESVGGTFNIDSMLSMGTTISLKFQILEEKDD